ncbi:MAG: reprolysin-like metallopeptidase [Marinicellaceae bacterium]
MYKLLLLLVTLNTMAMPSYWQLSDQISSSQYSHDYGFDIHPSKYQLIEFNQQALIYELMSSTENNKVISLPLPNGEFEEFSIQEVSIMESKLAIKYPEFRTFRGQSNQSNKTLVMDVTHKGLHAVMKSPNKKIWIDPVSRSNNTLHMSYYEKDVHNLNSDWKCDVKEHNHDLEQEFDSTIYEAQGGNLPNNGLALKTYRIAVATTAEYTTFHSNPNAANVKDGLAAVVTAMNRVNGIYELEVGIRMLLVDNNDQVIFTNAGTDGYSNNNGSAMLNQNINILNSVIGSANYDIGHVFSTGGGGVAFFGVTCTSSKGGGVTGLNSPINDAFYVDYVAHEIGHQWRGSHIFNATSGSCGGGNRTGSAAVEPGSGSTIMGYAGICGSFNDLQNRSDDYFNSYSLNQIISYSTTGSGSNCSNIIDTTNEAPVVEAGDNYSIPHSTPFTLCAQASDDNDTNMTFNWEQNDTGPAGNQNAATGNAPAFRSYNAVTDNCRTFPNLPSILNGSITKGEKLPGYQRNMNFRATVRDNELEGGGIGTDDMRIAVTADGPFQLTSLSNTETIVTGVVNTFKWDVANTDMNPVNCSTVEIDFSEDGGQTFDNVVTGIENTGTGSALVPALDSDQIRVRIKCSDNIFFDINDSNLSNIDDLIFDNGFESL